MRKKKKGNTGLFFLLSIGTFYFMSIGFSFRYKRLEAKMVELVRKVNQNELEIFSMQHDLQKQIYRSTEKKLYIQKYIPKVIFE